MSDHIDPDRIVPFNVYSGFVIQSVSYDLSGNQMDLLLLSYLYTGHSKMITWQNVKTQMKCRITVCYLQRNKIQFYLESIEK